MTLALIKSEKPTLMELLEYPVHPMAARFPLWPADRLAELAADIKSNGLNIPLVVWRREPMLLDGRNRLKACEIASIEPAVEFYDGEDPRALIISRNIQTREMTASQKAMLLAAEFPEPGKGGRGKKSDAGNLLVSSGFSRQLLDQARQINRWASDEVDNVIVGATKFDAALRKATVNRQAASSLEARLSRLQEGAADLARQVAEETLTLDEAEAAWRERQKREQIIRETGSRSLAEIGAIRTTAINIQMARALGERLHIDPEALAAAESGIALLRKMMEEDNEA
jgi:hypothetical protein